MMMMVKMMIMMMMMRMIMMKVMMMTSGIPFLSVVVLHKLTAGLFTIWTEKRSDISETGATSLSEGPQNQPRRFGSSRQCLLAGKWSQEAQ